MKTKVNLWPLLLIFGSLGLAVALCFGARELFLIYLGCFLSGAALELLSLLPARTHGPGWRFAPLAGLLVLLGLSIWDYSRCNDWFPELIFYVYGFFGAQYFLGWLMGFLMFPREKLPF